MLHVACRRLGQAYSGLDRAVRRASLPGPVPGVWVSSIACLRELHGGMRPLLVRLLAIPASVICRCLKSPHFRLSSLVHSARLQRAPPSCQETLHVISQLRNIAIIAHVDHGKTTLVDCLLAPIGNLGSQNAQALSESWTPMTRSASAVLLSWQRTRPFEWNDYRINIVDTPGHADFGGEVERVLSMVDSVCCSSMPWTGPCRKHGL